MKKLIAKTIEGKEYLHSKKDAYFAPKTSAEKIANILNKNRYLLKDGEKWHVYDYDFTHDFYVTSRLYIYKGQIKVAGL